MMIKVLTIISVLILSIGSLNTQAQNYSWYGSAKYHFGFAIAHRQNLNHLIEDYSSGLEVSYDYRPNGSKYWHKQYNSPIIGFTYLRLSLGNPTELGNAHSILGHIQFNIISKNNFDFTIKSSAGIAYLTKTWERTDNHHNTMIGSHLNIAIQIAPQISFKIAPNLFGITGLAFNHFSNGSTTMPNLGINIVSTEVGLRLMLQESTYSDSNQVSANYTPVNRNSLTITSGGFFKETSDESGERFTCWSLSGDYYKAINQKSACSFGIDFMYNGAIAKDYLKIEKKETKNEWDNIQAGLKVGYHLFVAKWDLLVEQGVYLHSLFYPNGKTYNRLGGRYNFSKKWYFNGTLKSHLFKADYFEFGVGCRVI